MASSGSRCRRSSATLRRKAVLLVHSSSSKWSARDGGRVDRLELEPEEVLLNSNNYLFILSLSPSKQHKRN